MTDLKNVLVETERNMIVDYIDRYARYDANGSGCGLDKLLRYWYQEKGSYLYELLGNQLIYEKPIVVEKPVSVLREEIGDAFYRDSRLSTFKRNVRDYFDNRRNEFHCSTESDDDYWNVMALFDTLYLAKNSYSGRPYNIYTPDEKKIAVLTGSKPVKMLGKIAEAFGIEGYENFRLAHSLLTNQRTLKGTLCLSIHPLDYMTMSDNNSGWSSCMSWKEQGCYCRGTVEMMNSKSVIVAYLKADDDMDLLGDSKYTWSNKKWRQLFVVNKEFVFGVKAYPYKNEDLATKVIDIVKELAAENLDWHYNDVFKIEHCTTVEHKNQKFYFNLETDTMYNDCGTVPHMVAINQAYYKDERIPDGFLNRRGRDDAFIFSYCYSGAAMCMNCGDTCCDYENEGCLICDDCNDCVYCQNCGERVNRNDAYEVDGDYYCNYCYDEHTQYDPISNEQHFEENFRTVHIVPDGYVEKCKLESKEPMFNRGYDASVWSDVVYGYYRHRLDRFVSDEVVGNEFPYYSTGWVGRYYLTPSMITDRFITDFLETNREALLEDLEVSYGNC